MLLFQSIFFLFLSAPPLPAAGYKDQYWHLNSADRTNLGKLIFLPFGILLPLLSLKIMESAYPVSDMLSNCDVPVVMAAFDLVPSNSYRIENDSPIFTISLAHVVTIISVAHVVFTQGGCNDSVSVPG